MNPVMKYLGSPLVSAGLAFGAISALHGLRHQIINQAQYSALVAAVVASAFIPIMSPMRFACRIMGHPKQKRKGHPRSPAECFRFAK